jgi:perosamine synthetase
MIKISYPDIRKDEIAAVVRVMESGMLAQGAVTQALEKDFSKLCGTDFAIATSSGTSALHTALTSLGIGPGDEVITTPFTFVATANSILMTGAKPVFVDIDETNFNINPAFIETRITKKTKAILAVDLYGQPADYKKINYIARKYKLFVIEDAAQSIGATYHGKKTGSISDIACFSLYATKNIISGEGGVITTNNKILNGRTRLFRHHGQDEKVKYQYSGLGYNYRMTDIQAAIAREQLKRIKSITKRRQEIAKKYSAAFKDIKGLIIPCISKGSTSVFHQYTLRITPEFKLGRNKFMEHLNDKGIQTNIYYPFPLYRFKHLRFNSKRGDFPVTEKVANEVLSIPVHPKLTNADVNYIIRVIKAI